jgi:uncharacterized protein YdaU (DUF1376 family)
VNYYPFHIGDFRSGTVNMSRMARWIYRDMLDVYYDKEQPLPLDLDKLYDMLGVDADDERRTVERVLRLKFVKGEDGYRNAICDRVIAEYYTKAETARANGAKGGRPRKAGANQEQPSGKQEKPSGFLFGSNQDAIRNPVETGSQANQEPITKNQEPKTINVKPIVPPDGATTVAREMVGAVFSYWQNQRGHDRAKLDDKRSKAIRARLKDGYSVEDLCRAVDGIAKSAHHMGQNDNRAVYDDIELICRSAVNVDKFVKLAVAPVGAPQRTHSQQQTINNLQAYLEGKA